MAYKRGTRFGVRLYTVNVYSRLTRKAISFHTPALHVDNGTVVDDLVHIANSHIDDRRFGQIRLKNVDDSSERAEEEPEAKTEPAIKIVSAEYHGGLIRFTFAWGRTGTANEGMARESDDDVPLDGRAPSNHYVATLFPAKGEGSSLLAVETRARVCPADDLCKLLSLFLKEEFESRHSLSAKKVKPTLTDTWWRLQPKAVSDRDRLTEVMKDGHAAGAVLKKSTGGTGRKQNELELRRNLLPAGVGERVKATLLTWGKKKPSDYGVDAEPFEGDSLQQIEALIDHPMEEVDWDSGAIVYEMPEGDRVTFEPGNLRDVFTYPLSTGRHITFVDIEGEASKRAKKLMPALGIEVELE